MNNENERGRYALSFGLLFVAYFASALFGLSLHPVSTFAAFIWPPTGIAIAALFLYGYRLAPAIFLGAFFANLYTGAPFLVALSIGIGNTAEAVAAVYVLKRFFGETFAFSNLTQSLIFIVVSLTASVISATTGVGSLLASGVVTVSNFGPAWFTWWIGDALGALIIAPFLLRWLSPVLFRRSLTQFLELGSVAALSLAVSTFVFHTSYIKYPYIIFVPLVWAALRTGPKGVSLSLLLSAIAAISGTLAGSGPFSHMPIQEALLTLQLFMGTVAAIFLVFVSVVEDRRKANITTMDHVERLEQALEKIQAEDRAKQEFLAILAHELRNPLSPILSSTELARLPGANKEDILRATLTIEKHARSMSRLLDDLLDISRISRRKLKLRKKPMYLCHIVAQAVEAVEPLIKSRSHSLDVSIIQKPILIEADPLRLEQILVNILNNAAKYTPRGGRISLTCTREKGDVVIAIQDTGAGIEKGMLERIFEPFVQAGVEGHVQTGIGIGLTLSKKLVEMHGGAIGVASPGVGKGSTFTVRFPLPIAIKSVESRKEAHGRKRPLESLNILVVDDNRDAAEAIGRLLTIRGHSVSLAVNGKSSLRVAAELAPDVIVLDIGLPDMDGYTVARELKKAGVTAVLIALTGYGQVSDRLKAQRAGFAYHLVKPIGLAKLEEALANVTAQRTNPAPRRHPVLV
ncbi:MASE1 domain-containing protein [Candidatus Uhrbacteria bacterium]|nr:MASE1 domain-containing protein [Candidatus Uhrbacteria bacterium]